MDGRDCVYVKFEGSQTPYFAFGVAKIRVADEDLTMSPQELADYIRKGDKEENRWENLVSNKFVDDVDEDIIKEYEEILEGYGFIRVHKSHIVNRIHIINYSSDGILTLSDHAKVEISRRRREEVSQKIKPAK